MKRPSPKAWLPLAVLLGGAVAGTGLVAISPDVETASPERLPPLVRVIEAQPRPATLRVFAQGTVVPRTESDLVAEVAGRITWVSPSLASGGFIEADEVLVRIDPRDYDIALRRAEAGVERSASELALARSSLERQQTLADRGVASTAALDDARNAARVAEAAHGDAMAALERARSDLERSEVRAPFAGRVREKHVDVGQFVARGAPLARVYAVDYAEVRLPIQDSDAAFVDLPIAYRETVADADANREGPRVVLRSRFAGRDHQWEGRIVRTEGEIDPRTRMIHAVARVEDPYGRSDDPDRPPLAVGLFVDAEIEGRVVESVVELPRRALRGHDGVATVDAEGRLWRRRVDVLQRGQDRVLVSGGIAAGERIVTSPLPVSVDGMTVRVELEPASPPNELLDARESSTPEQRSG